MLATFQNELFFKSSYRTEYERGMSPKITRKQYVFLKTKILNPNDWVFMRAYDSTDVIKLRLICKIVFSFAIPPMRWLLDSPKRRRVL